VECWIDVVHERDRSVVRLAGRLGGEAVPDLSVACSNIASGRLHIDLSDLLNADAIGVEALRRLRREGATFVGLSEYLRLKLDAAG
jgi:hypothetical protein